MTVLNPMLGIILAVCAAFYLPVAMPGEQVYWLQIAILVAALVLCPAWIAPRTKYFLLAAGIACVCAALGGLMAAHFFGCVAFLGLVTLIAAYTGLSYPLYWSFTFLIVFFSYLGAAFPTDLTTAEHRLGLALAGFFSAALIAEIFFRTSSQSQALVNLAACLNKLSQLNKTIFILFQQQDYQENVFFYEKKLHKAQREYWYSVWRARKACQGNKQNSLLHQLLSQIEQVYELLNALALLLQRIEDHSTFEAGNREFTGLSTTLSKQIESLARAVRRPGKMPVLDPEELPAFIHELEEVNRNAFQVVVYDPLVVALFIHDLYWLNEVLQQLSLITAQTVKHA
jgi:hypothetical protein